jgi:uncharacterized damage-inducible protein DinB
MDQVIEFAVGLMERNWNDLKRALQDMTDDELDWRPVPESNTLRSIVRHLRTVEQLYLSLLEGGSDPLERCGVCTPTHRCDHR